jgi:hypothetical protein
LLSQTIPADFAGFEEAAKLQGVLGPVPTGADSNVRGVIALDDFEVAEQTNYSADITPVSDAEFDAIESLFTRMDNFETGPYREGTGLKLEGDGTTFSLLKPWENPNFDYNASLVTGTASPVVGNPTMGLFKRLDNELTGGLFLNHNSVVDQADIEAYSNTPLFGIDGLTHGDVFDASVTAAEYLGYAELGLAVGSLKAFIRNLDADNAKYAADKTSSGDPLDIEFTLHDFSKFVDELDASVQARKDVLLATKTNAELKALAATSKSGIADLGITSSKSYENIVGFGFKKNSPDIPGVIRDHDSGTFVISDRVAYIDLVRDQYKAAGNPLHPFTEKLIVNHLDGVGGRSGGAFEFHAGLPGFHAEVQSFNDVIRQLPKNTDFNTFDLSRVQVSTYKVAPSKGQGQAFPACSNCSGILPSPINILTGRK